MDVFTNVSKRDTQVETKIKGIPSWCTNLSPN